MDSWRDVAARALADERMTDPVVPQHAEQLLDAGQSDWRAGLGRLRDMRPPKRLRSAEHWNEVVRDALRLDADGWVERAIDLGWLPIEMFGIGSKSSEDYEGLAIWLAGRRIILIDGRSAIVATDTGHAIFSRRQNPDASAVGAVLLWDFGRR